MESYPAALVRKFLCLLSNQLIGKLDDTHFLNTTAVNFAEHLLHLAPINDSLIHRPKADWSVVYVNSELNETEIWLQASLQQDASSEMNFKKPIEKFFFMSIDKLSYGREALLASTETQEKSKYVRLLDSFVLLVS